MDDQKIPATTDVAAPKPPTFDSFLQLFNDGILAREASEQTRALIAEMQHTYETTGGAPVGEVRLSLRVKLDGGIFEGRGEIAIKHPKTPRRKSIFYGLKDGTWAANNPRQGELPLAEAPRDVSTSAPLRSMRAI